MSLMLQCIFFALLILCLSSITSVYSEANDNVQPISNPTNNFCDRLQQSSSQPMAFQAFVADPKNGDLILFVESNQLYQAQKADLDHFAHHELTEPNWFKYLTDQLMTKRHFTEDAKQIRWFHCFRKDDETVLILEMNDSEGKTEYHYNLYVGDKVVPKHKQQKPFRMISSLESNAKQVHYVFTYDSKTNQIVMIQNGDQQVSAFNVTENLDVSSYIWTIDSGTGRITLKSQTEQIKPDELLFTSLPVGFIHGNTVYLFQVDTKMVITMKYRDISADEDKQRDESIRAIPMSKFFVNCVTNANVFLTSTNESDIGITPTSTTEPTWLYYLTNNPVMIVLGIVLVVLLVVCIILACKCFCKSNNRLGHLSKKWKSLDYLTTTRKKNPKPIAKKSSSTIESSSGSSSEWTSTQKTVGAKRQTKLTPKESPSNVKHQKTSPMGVDVSPRRPTTTRSASPAGKLAGRKQTISTGRREVALCTHQRHSPKKVTVNTSPKVLPKKIPSVPPSLRGCIVDPLSPLNTAKQGTMQNSLAIAKQNKRQQPK